QAILEVYATNFEVRDKSDASPVTAADERAEAIILAALAKLTPSIPVVSEEAAAAGRTPAVAERFWLVDPLDGTKEFINRNGEFTVNIALIENGYPTLGVVLAPRGSAHSSKSTMNGVPLPVAPCRPRALPSSPAAPMAMPKRWRGSSPG